MLAKGDVVEEPPRRHSPVAHTAQLLILKKVCAR